MIVQGYCCYALSIIDMMIAALDDTAIKVFINKRSIFRGGN